MQALFDIERTARTFAQSFDPGTADTLRELLRSLETCLSRALPPELSLRLDREGATLRRDAGGRLRVEAPPVLRAALRELASLDLFRLFLSAAQGGLGLPLGLFYLAVSRIAARDAALALTVLVQANVVYCLARHGSEAQRQRYLARLAAGELLGTVAYTEPLAGSDAGAIRTRAEPEAGGFRITGSKCWITHGGDADLLLTSARTGGLELGITGVSTFLLEREADGVEVLGLENKTGLAGSPTAALDYPAIWIAGDRLVGREGDGGRVMFSGIGITRVGIGAQALGIGRRAFDAAVEFAGQRQQGGRLIIEHPAVEERLCRMALQLSTMENLISWASLLESRGEWHVREMSITKHYCTEALQDLTQRAIGLHGGCGCSRDYPVERCRREAVALPLFGGTSEIQWWIITRELLETVRGEAHVDYRARDSATLAELRPRCASGRLSALWEQLRSARGELWSAAERVASLPDPAPVAHLLAEAATGIEAAQALLRQACGPEAGELEAELAVAALAALEPQLAATCGRIRRGDHGASLRAALRRSLP